MNRVCLALLATILAVGAAEPLRVWSYEDPTALAATVFSHASTGGTVARRVSADVRTPEGKAALEVVFTAPPPPCKPWDVQVNFQHLGGLKAGQAYAITFQCRASVPGELWLAAALGVAPWTQLPDADARVRIAGTQWQQVTLEFTAQKDLTEKLVLPRLMLAQFAPAATLHIGPVTLAPR